MSDLISGLIAARLAAASDPNAKANGILINEIVKEMHANSKKSISDTAEHIIAAKARLYESPHADKMAKAQDVLDELLQSLTK